MHRSKRWHQKTSLVAMFAHPEFYKCINVTENLQENKLKCKVCNAPSRKRSIFILKICHR